MFLNMNVQQFLKCKKKKKKLALINFFRKLYIIIELISVTFITKQLPVCTYNINAHYLYIVINKCLHAYFSVGVHIRTFLTL